MMIERQSAPLPTMRADGTREKVRPRVSKGRFWQRRRVVAYVLVALFLSLPHLPINGRPAMLLDLGTREFSFFGSIFRPSDTLSLMLFGLTLTFGIVLVTALWGRVWCGWGCPQTVWLEWIFRPIERFFEGTPAQQRAMDKAGGIHGRRVVKHLVYLGLAFLVGNTFLAYFVGAARVEHWVQASPANHPVGFMVVLAVTGGMYFDFAFFREQTCMFVCPYGRFQSVMIDQHSMIVGYDHLRGEPRAKRSKTALPILRDGATTVGDCVDCGACVQACPTGLDIRKGLQMECIGCAQCVDACDAVMDKLKEPRGLIRYSSHVQLNGGERKLLRARTVIYPALMGAALIGLVLSLSNRAPADVWLEKNKTAYDIVDTGEVSTPVKVRLENRAGETRKYTLALDDIKTARIVGLMPTYTLTAGQTQQIPFFVLSPRDSFKDGRRVAQLVVSDSTGWSRNLSVTLLGPERGATP